MLLPHALTIAGSDSGGGAGIQADLKTFSALGVFGMSAITAVTLQNTSAVLGVEEMPAAVVAGQIDAVFSDIRVDAVKIGMLFSSATIQAVADCLRRWQPRYVVLDPVMISKSGHALMQPEACATLQRELLPLATLVTPNLPEAEALIGRTVQTVADMEQAAQAILALGARAALVKGGHFSGAADDLLHDGQKLHWLSGSRLTASNTHGTGCTLSSAITALLARGKDLATACRQAKNYVRGAMSAGLEVGKGHGPLHHFYQWYGDKTQHLPDLDIDVSETIAAAATDDKSDQQLQMCPDLLAAAAAGLSQIRSQSPLVHHLTNAVTVNDCANAVLAIGGSPVMAPCQQEADAMASLSQALVLNIGTPDDFSEQAMIAAGQAANKAGIPVILDPVGVGATSFRRELVEKIMQQVKVTILRGNLAEIKTMTGQSALTRGVDSGEDILEGGCSNANIISPEVRQLALTAARRFDCVVAITGAVDVVSDGQRVLTLHNGDPMLARITGTGCVASSLCATFAAVMPQQQLLAAAAALVCLGIAGEAAAANLMANEGNGSFRVKLIDALSLMTENNLQQKIRCYDC